ncbi:hypothetical protein CVT24_006100 [Panaeolus cyanescens]|uniref:UBC core domain-containing protein n=1 Tax=Panaeolus cyanescens TaxID=181874 RepID=A0A409V8S5_9AGAR|nr:hypothetical protein CVT24_006100 [Panaeolus cyanescens]
MSKAPPNQTTQSTATKLFQQDIVQKNNDPTYIGIVLRCWHDPEDVPPQPHVDPLMRPLAYGEVGVTFMSHLQKREILLESELRLVDRTLQPGDYCKKSIDDVRAGVVTNISVKGRIQHALSNEPMPVKWVTLSDLEDRGDAEIGDYVVYDDWVGQVFDESVVEVGTKQLVRLPELGSRLAVGETGPNILPPTPSGMQSLFNNLFPGFSSTTKNDLVIAVRHTAYAVAWLALNQSLEPSITSTKTRPKRFWYGADLGKLTLIRGRSDLEMRVSDRVHLKDVTGMPVTEHGRPDDPTGVVQVHTFCVTETSTELEVLWQDGERESLRAIDVIPYLNPDEYDCWPGDHVMWKSEDTKRPAIVQTVNARDRTAQIHFPDTNTTELVSLLELDAHGTSEFNPTNAQIAPEAYGVRRGDFVFIHTPGSTNGMQLPRVPQIGELEPWVREQPFLRGEFNGWRKELQDIGIKLAEDRSSDPSLEGIIQTPQKNDGKIRWCGEVTGLNLDGTVEVTHPDWTVATYPLERLTRLHDGLEQLEDETWEDGSEGVDSDDGNWNMEIESHWDPRNHSDEWYEYSDDDAHMEGDEAEEMEVDRSIVPPHAASPSEDLPDSQTQEAHTIPSSDQGKVSNDEDMWDDHNISKDSTWKRFDILSSAPVDHAFYSSAPAQPSKAFLGRLNREYKALESSLPDSIIVRAYEDRTDLLRSLIIGPENTPYEDAPFVIDWMLDSNFPQSPPVAHFLSWTNGNGRVNPNLYEEGKVCLSILGTWSGDKSESWNPSRSSLLQALVSIQGLVLVKEPWFCEPAYDKLRGTEEGIVNSRLYSEKAYVLARGFVRRALEIPLVDLASEISHFYYEKGCLKKVIRDAELLIEVSRQNTEPTQEEQNTRAVPRLTAGGIIALERTLNKLRSLASQPRTS